MSKIFITGATGFVGQNLVRFYKQQDHQVHEFQRGQSLVNELINFAPDIIINSAAEIYKAEDMITPNSVFVYTILEYIKTAPQRVKMLQIGSSSEYGPTDHATAEDTLPKPIDFYQGTKAAGTMLCQGWARQFDLPIWIARPYSVFGPGEREHRLFPRLYRAFKRNQPMTLYQGHHDFIYIDDFVQGMDLMINSWDLPPGEIVNFGSGIQTSNFELLSIFEQITGTTAPVSKVAELSKVFENNIWVCDTTRARELYNYQPKYSLQQGVADFLEKASY